MEHEPNNNIKSNVKLANGFELKYELTENYTGLDVVVVDSKNIEQIDIKVEKSLKEDYWFLNPDCDQKLLVSRHEIRLDNQKKVEIINFQKDFDKDKLTQIAESLALLYQSLKDKSLWNLEMILLRSSDSINPKSGEVFRGKEFKDQYRFELFPATFATDGYRDGLSCSWLQGTVVHEATHVILEKKLNNLWNTGDNLKKLGWVILSDKILIFPGGGETPYDNKHYLSLPTEYASYTFEDDMAESVVAFLYDSSKLKDKLRPSLIGELLNPPDKLNLDYEIIEKELVLPTLELPKISVRVIEINELAKTKSKNSLPKIPIKEHRQKQNSTNHTSNV